MFTYNDIVSIGKESFKIIAIDSAKESYLLENGNGDLVGWFKKSEIDNGLTQCSIDKHNWNDFGSINTWCLDCDIDGEWDRKTAKYKKKST